MSADPAMLELRGVEIAYGGVVAVRELSLEVRHGAVHAVRGLSLTVGRGEIVGLIGPNGAGKSSTLHAIMGVCDRIQVLDQGRTLAEGSPTEIRGNLDVAAAYLGESAVRE